MAITGTTAAELRAMLAGKTLYFNSYTYQTFAEDGSTEYFDPERYPGRWRVSDAHFESVWPPSAVWAKYDITLEDDGLLFEGFGEKFKGYWQAPE